MFEKPFLGKNNRNEKKTTLSRRGFLKGALATSALSAIGGSLGAEAILREKDFSVWLKERASRMRYEEWPELSPEEKEQRIDTEVHIYGDFIRSAEGKRILEFGTDEEIFSLLKAMPAILREHVRDTKYDVSTDRWPSLAVGDYFNEDDTLQVLDVHHEPKELYAFYVGNGFAIDASTYLTNWHVIRDQARRYCEYYNIPKASLIPYEENYDLGLDVVATSFPNKRNDQIEYPTSMPACLTLNDDDVHGKFIRIAGIDPDETADNDGIKIYPSIAIRMTPRLCELFGGQYLLNSFLYALPPGEGMERAMPSETGLRLLDFVTEKGSDVKGFRAQGTSGSPVLLDSEVIGINHSVIDLEREGLCLEFGFFNGPDAIQKALGAGMVYQPLTTEDRTSTKTDFGG